MSILVDSGQYEFAETLLISILGGSGQYEFTETLLISILVGSGQYSSSNHLLSANLSHSDYWQNMKVTDKTGNRITTQRR